MILSSSSTSCSSSSGCLFVVFFRFPFPPLFIRCFRSSLLGLQGEGPEELGEETGGEEGEEGEVV